MIFLKHTLFLFLFAFSLAGMAQITGDSLSVPSLDYAKPKEYSIASVSVTCSEFTDKSVVRLLSGLQEGEKIQLPGDKIAEAIKSLWKQGLFEDVQIYLLKTIGKEAFINIVVVEKPRLTKFGFSNNVKKNDADDIRGKLRLVPGKVITDFTIGYIKNIASKSLAKVDLPLPDLPTTPIFSCFFILNVILSRAGSRVVFS